MANSPTGRTVPCPECGAEAIAIVPEGSQIVSSEEAADAKVWVDCPDCGNRFFVSYRTSR